MSEFYTQPQQLKAAKQHRCEWCGERIEAGEHYWRRVGNYQGEFHVERWHGECKEAFDTFFSDRYNDEYTMRGMRRGYPDFI